MNRTTLSVAAASSAMALLAGCGASGGGGEGGAGAGRGTTLRLALNQSEDHPSFVALDHFADRLTESTDGRWNIEVFPNENLGAQQEALQLTSDGSVDLAIVSGTQLEDLNKDFVAFNLPHVFDSVDHQMKVINDKKIVGGLYSSLEDRNDLTVLGGFTQGTRSIYADKPVTKPADLAGMKVRVQESKVHIRMIELMGGAATPMSYGEVYTALQSGVLDGAENNEVSYVTQKHFEVAKHWSRTDHLVGLDYLVGNTGRLESMSDRDRAAFDREWAAAMKEFTRLWKTETAQAVADAKSAGVQFHDVDEKAFRKALAPLTDEALTTETAREVYEASRRAAG
ncbi:TRAP transporter substrate-binding protein [Streptomyces cavernicola]|uniref:TRAP transporter substrate-binding protein n=1 Tax=Streptomyces cavernicola TaxID=3043613 RepID=A0ABT6S5N6_9ACTN|nr:TRAP transporter substrate-binding protein [Streptomyces sp. B-S-A6]MDI3403411.1 TRAP transporter substrate-binding protein [Streptomyces sp. B-S-A6]